MKMMDKTCELFFFQSLINSFFCKIYISFLSFTPTKKHAPCVKYRHYYLGRKTKCTHTTKNTALIRDGGRREMKWSLYQISPIPQGQKNKMHTHTHTHTVKRSRKGFPSHGRWRVWRHGRRYRRLRILGARSPWSDPWAEFSVQWALSESTLLSRKPNKAALPCLCVVGRGYLRASGNIYIYIGYYFYMDLYGSNITRCWREW